jgi:hypothetical protein
MAHHLIESALVMSHVSSSVADRVVYQILLVPHAVFYVQSLGSQILTLKCQNLEFVLIRTFWREMEGALDSAIPFLRNWIHTYIHSIDPWDCHKTMGCGTRYKHTNIFEILQCKMLWTFTQSYKSGIHVICTCGKFIHRVKGMCT